MAVIRERRNKDGELTGYKVVVTLGRDERNRKVYEWIKEMYGED